MVSEIRPKMIVTMYTSIPSHVRCHSMGCIAISKWSHGRAKTRLGWAGPAPAGLAPLAHHATGANATPLTGYGQGPDPSRPRHRLALRHSPSPPLSPCACSVHRFSHPFLLQRAAPRSRMRLIAMIPSRRDPRKNARSLSQTLRL